MSVSTQARGPSAAGNPKVRIWRTAIYGMLVLGAAALVVAYAYTLLFPGDV